MSNNADPALSTPKVGRKPAFTAEQAVAAAVAEGIDTFTLAAVASRLGVVTPALYRVFASREELVIACLDHVAATIAIPESGAPWQAALRRWADECWRCCEEFPGLSRVLYSIPLAPTRITKVFRDYADLLVAQGKTSPQALFALDFIAETVFSAHRGAEVMRAIDENGRRGLDVLRAGVDDDDLLRPEESWTGRQAMDLRIDFILTGLEQHWPNT